MPILKAIKAPSGADIGYHVAQRVEAQLSDPQQSIMVCVASWPSAEAHDGNDGKTPTWVDWYSVPFAMVIAQTGDVSSIFERALIAVQGGALGGGVYTVASDGLAGARMRRWANIKLQRDLLDNEPIQINGFDVDADAGSRTDIMGAVMAMQLTGQASRLWRCTDNTMREMTLADLVQVGTAIAARRQQLIEISDALYQALQAAETVEQVEAVVWPTGAPS